MSSKAPPTTIVQAAAYLYRGRNGHDMVGVWCCDCWQVHAWSATGDLSAPRASQCHQRGGDWFGKQLVFVICGRVNSWADVPTVSLSCAVIAAVRALLRRLAGRDAGPVDRDG